MIPILTGRTQLLSLASLAVLLFAMTAHALEDCEQGCFEYKELWNKANNVVWEYDAFYAYNSFLNTNPDGAPQSGGPESAFRIRIWSEGDPKCNQQHTSGEGQKVGGPGQWGEWQSPQYECGPVDPPQT